MLTKAVRNDVGGHRVLYQRKFFETSPLDDEPPVEPQKPPDLTEEILRVMSVRRRKDSGAWEVTLNVPGHAPHRHSDQNWSKRDAKAYEAQQLVMLDKPLHTLGDAIDKWKKEQLPRLRSKRHVEDHLRQLEPYTKDKLLIDAPEVATAVILGMAKLAPATVNQRLAILRRVCNLAFKIWHWLDQPIANRIQLLTVQNERHIYLTRAQVEDLAFKCQRREAGNLLIFSAFTGLRLSELFRARASDVWKTHDGKASLRVERRTKNGKPRSVPLHPRAENIAVRMPLSITRVTLRQEWLRARKAAGLQHVHWHDLRHTFASWCIHAGATLVELKELMGHQTVEMTMRYAHLLPHAAHSVIARM